MLMSSLSGMLVYLIPVRHRDGIFDTYTRSSTMSEKKSPQPWDGSPRPSPSGKSLQQHNMLAAMVHIDPNI